jgi:hypothetical protein
MQDHIHRLGISTEIQNSHSFTAFAQLKTWRNPHKTASPGLLFNLYKVKKRFPVNLSKPLFISSKRGKSAFSDTEYSTTQYSTRG